VGQPAGSDPFASDTGEIRYSPISERRLTVDGQIKSRRTANGIIKQAGIDHHF
jgi:hypothetical protein